jgi:hypothetical protein
MGSKSKPFTYSTEALEILSATISNQANERAGFFLQLVCREMEELAIIRSPADNNEIIIEQADFGGS